jgi:hypothetical protein
LQCWLFGCLRQGNQRIDEYALFESIEQIKRINLTLLVAHYACKVV